MRVKRLSISFLVTLASLSLLAAAEKGGDKELLDNLDLFTDVVAMIDEDYYQDVRPGDLMMGAIGGVMASLDRYSYVKRKEDGEGACIGADFAVVDNILTVVSAVEGGPAARAGVIHGDKVVKIGEELISNVTLDEVNRMLRGAPGSKVTLTIYREGAKGTKDVVLERREIASPGLVESLIYDAPIGYMRLASLPAGSSREFTEALDGLLREGMKGLIIDLRDNPGGDIDAAVQMAGHLIGNGKKFASVESRMEGERREFRAPEAAPPPLSVAVLVNGGTAGEAEVIAGSLKEAGKALLIGSQTFGKGAVQRDIPLDDDLMLHLTVGRYTVGDEESFDGKGIEPDVEVEVGLDGEALLQKAREGVREDDKEMPADIQFERAIDLLKGIRILGGGAGA